MGRKSSDSWFFISLNDPFTILPEPPASIIMGTEPQVEPAPQQSSVDGTVTIRLTKPTKVKSLSLSFTGVAKTSFFFDSSSISGAQPCIPYGKMQFFVLLFYSRFALLLQTDPHRHAQSTVHNPQLPLSYRHSSQSWLSVLPILPPLCPSLPSSYPDLLSA